MNLHYLYLVVLLITGFFLPAQTLSFAQAHEKTMKKIEGGKFSMYIPDSNYHIKAEAKFEEKEIAGFYLCDAEVSNANYRLFTEEAKKTDTTLWKKILPDTTVWLQKRGYSELHVRYYFRNSSYNEFPVVGISYEQCELYCKWLTEKYNADSKRTFKKVVFALPTRMQWYYAVCQTANATRGKQILSTKFSAQKMFPWDGTGTTNYKGMQLANFTTIRQTDIIGSADKNGKFQFTFTQEAGGTYSGNERRYTDEKYPAFSDYTLTIYSYWPNDAGLYNMAGNVSEYVREKGITKGGSWADTGFFLRNITEAYYNEKNATSNSRGFRVAMEVLEE